MMPLRLLSSPTPSARSRQIGVLALYRTAGWWPERTAAQLSAVLRGSPAAVGAWHGMAWHGGQLIGFARAVTDGVLRAYVEDVIVAPGHSGGGVEQAPDRGAWLNPGCHAVLLAPAGPLLRGQLVRRYRQVVMHRIMPD